MSKPQPPDVDGHLPTVNLPARELAAYLGTTQEELREIPTDAWPRLLIESLISDADSASPHDSGVPIPPGWPAGKQETARRTRERRTLRSRERFWYGMRLLGVRLTDAQLANAIADVSSGSLVRLVGAVYGARDIPSATRFARIYLEAHTNERAELKEALRLVQKTGAALRRLHDRLYGRLFESELIEGAWELENTASAIASILGAIGSTAPTGGRRRDAHITDAAVLLAEKGLSQEKIRQRLGLSSTRAVRGRLRSAGVPPKLPRPKVR